MSLFPPDLLSEAEALLSACRAAGVKLVTVESCTGGLVSALLTEIAGSSDVVDGGFITYSNLAKERAVGVRGDLIGQHGAVSEAVARAMAEGALHVSSATLAVSITGVAGPGGGSAEKPVGLVHFATAIRGGETLAHVERFGDLGRSEVRLASVWTAIGLLRGRV
ncbi:CinA family protein [Caulobacter sp. S45]|uniref:CinA family protein n=1 Tax=Caulobacter sp. S45 TaxID=1641861 RepID=UPI00131DA4E8